jgi:hypothetical protein
MKTSLLFKKNAIERAKEFDVAAILPKYEAFYLKVLAQYKDKNLISHTK